MTCLETTSYNSVYIVQHEFVCYWMLHCVFYSICTAVSVLSYFLQVLHISRKTVVSSRILYCTGQ
jgi:hypothetical protein